MSNKLPTIGSGFSPGIFAESCRMRLVLTHKMSSIVKGASVTTLRNITRTSIFVEISANKYARYLIKRLVAYSWTSHRGSDAGCSYQLLS
jgi:hypothetical protein